MYLTASMLRYCGHRSSQDIIQIHRLRGFTLLSTPNVAGIGERLKNKQKGTQRAPIVHHEKISAQRLE